MGIRSNDADELDRTLTAPTRGQRIEVLAGSFLALWVSINALIATDDFAFSKPNDERQIRFVDLAFRFLLGEMCFSFAVFCIIFMIWATFVPEWTVRTLAATGKRVWWALFIFATGAASIAIGTALISLTHG